MIHEKSKYDNGVNFDYLLAINFDGKKIEKINVDISRSDYVISRLIAMVDDESVDADTMYHSFCNKIMNNGVFNYCLGYEQLRSFYISPIEYPTFDSIKYSQSYHKYKELIRKAKSEALKEKAIDNFSRWNKKEKKDLLQKCLTYIYALDYNNAILCNKVESRYFMYSNENHGRFKYEKSINDDIKLEVKTNFCYGSSSSFVVTISYKGIPIHPYSIWVKYYYAGFNEIIRCTRSYRPERQSWHYCMDFVVWFVNKALDNPDAFVKETVMDEVNILVKDLEEVLTISDEKMKEKLCVSTLNDEYLSSKYYIGIRCVRDANQQDTSYYTIAPEESRLVYRLEKITGALHFLKSLRKLSDIYSDIFDAINRIKEINKQLYPEIIEAIPPVSVYISQLNAELKPLERKMEIKQKRFDQLDEWLEKKLSSVEWGKKDEAKDAFIKKHPDYKKLEMEINTLNEQIWQLRNKILNRETFLRRLQDSKLLVEQYTDITRLSISIINP